MRLVIIVFAIIAGLPPSPAHAQSRVSSSRQLEISAGTGWGSLWDDETMLGRGVPIGVGIGWVVGERVRLSGNVDWMKLSRDAGYLAADGNLVGVFGLATYLSGAPASSVRALAGGGVGVLRSTGTFTISTIVPGPNGMPTAGPSSYAPWTATSPAFDVHGGVRIAVHPRAALRPEFQWRSSFGSASTTGIEAPLVNMQATVSVDVLAW